MKNNVFLVFVIVLLFGCQSSQDAEFNTLIESIEKNEKIHFLDEAIKAEPFHKITIIELLQTKDSIFSINHYRKIEEGLSNYNSSRLNERNQVTLKSLSTFLQNKIEMLGKGEDGRFFSILSILKQDINNESQTDEEQFKKIIQDLEIIPKYFDEAKFVIKNPDEEQLRLAIDTYSKDYFFIKNNLPSLIRKPDILKDAQIDFSNKNYKAQIAIKDFLAFLNSHLFELGNTF